MPLFAVFLRIMAVYTQITAEDLKSLLAKFAVGELQSFEGIAEGVENSNYLITTTTGKYVLTLIEKRAQPDELPFYTGFMAHLSDKGIPAARVVPDKTGERIHTVSNRPALLTEFIEGTWPREIYAHHCQAIGELLARMHRAGKSFTLKRHNTMALPAWEGLIHACATRADEVEPGLFALLESELQYLKLNRPKLLPKGAIHADLFPDNVFFRDEKVSGVIDFYFSCWDTVAYDLMLTFNPWCFDWKGDLDTARAHAFLSSYNQGRPLTKNELKALPYFGRAAAVRIVATRLYDWLNPVEGALVRAKDPMEHVKILRFHQKVTSLADYGFAP
ncbi:MAG: thrB [Alphaproteobacteria bacterium]|jgi:homoserine kinase type II|nr:thrB [Alphaproteobacteria bacterium]